MEELGIIGVNVFSIVLIGWIDDNKEFFEEEDHNMHIYNVSLVAPANALDRI